MRLLVRLSSHSLWLTMMS